MNKIYKTFNNITYKYVKNNNNRKYIDIRPNLKRKNGLIITWQIIYICIFYMGY